MTLKAIVAALGGDLYAGGTRASVPAPGHSAHDRSISLLLEGDRLVVHSFGETDWRAARDDLRARGLIDGHGRLVAGALASGRGGLPAPDRRTRTAAARRLWDGAGPVGPGALSRRHLELRAIDRDSAGIGSLRPHPAAPVSAYRSGGPTRPALLAAILSPAGALTAVEVVYLASSGRRDDRLRLPRKTVGVLAPGSAVRLAPAAPTLLVGEGIMTVLSAAEWFGQPAWALLSARNLVAWRPPGAVRSVLIAADRGAPGERAARDLAVALDLRGVAATIALPPSPAEDWNAAAVAERRKGGCGGAPVRRG